LKTTCNTILKHILVNIQNSYSSAISHIYNPLGLSIFYIHKNLPWVTANKQEFISLLRAQFKNIFVTEENINQEFI